MTILVTEEGQEARLDICKNCPFYNAKRNKCTKCGCFMKYKVKLTRSKCPAGYWGCVDCEVK